MELLLYLKYFTSCRSRLAYWKRFRLELVGATSSLVELGFKLRNFTLTSLNHEVKFEDYVHLYCVKQYGERQ